MNCSRSVFDGVRSSFTLDDFIWTKKCSDVFFDLSRFLIITLVPGDNSFITLFPEEKDLTIFSLYSEAELVLG